MSNKFTSTEGVGKRIWNGVKKNAIVFGEPTSNETDEENAPNARWLGAVYTYCINCSWDDFRLCWW